MDGWCGGGGVGWWWGGVDGHGVVLDGGAGGCWGVVVWCE